jgi:hypothetical protein
VLVLSSPAEKLPTVSAAPAGAVVIGASTSSARAPVATIREPARQGVIVALVAAQA